MLAEALRGQADRRRGGGRALPLVVLAELRLRQGRTEEAAHLLTGLDDDPAALGAAGGAAPRSAATRPWPWPCSIATRDADEPHLLGLRGAVALSTGDPDGAGAVAERLREVAEALAREDLARGGEPAGRPRRGRPR